MLMALECKIFLQRRTTLNLRQGSQDQYNLAICEVYSIVNSGGKVSILWNGILYDSKIIFHIAHTHVFNFLSKSINIFEENVESFFLLYVSSSYLAIFKCFLLFFSLIKFRRRMKSSLKDYYVVFVKKIFIKTWE